MPVFNQSRSRIIRFIFLAVFLILLAQIFHLQVVSREYKRQADINAIFAKRDYILPEGSSSTGRTGRSCNTLMSDLMVTPSEIKGIDTAYFCQLMEIDTAEFNRSTRMPIIKNKAFRPSVFEELLTPQNVRCVWKKTCGGLATASFFNPDR